MGCLGSMCGATVSENDVTGLKESDAYYKEYNKAIKLILLGSGESGKSTITKQMKIIFINGFDDEERKAKIRDIRNNILESLQSILEAMEDMSPPVHLQNAGNVKRKDYVMSLKQETSIYTQEFFADAAELWKDPGVQRAYQRSNEFLLIDCAQYFLDRIETVRQEDYIPSDQDILQCRVRTTDISKIEFIVSVPRSMGGGKAAFWMYDVGGQRGEQRKWIYMFEGVHAVIFVVDASSFDLMLREDPTKNRLREAVKLFGQVWDTRYLLAVDIIIFFNKQDVLRQKIGKGVRIEDYFPEYTAFCRDRGNEDPVNNASEFITQLFFEIVKRPKRMSVDIDSRKQSLFTDRIVFRHYTTAVDTDNIKRVFKDCHTSIINKHLSAVAPQI